MGEWLDNSGNDVWLPLEEYVESAMDLKCVYSFESTKDSNEAFYLQRAWHSSNTLLTMVHDQAFRSVTCRMTPVERTSQIRHTEKLCRLNIIQLLMHWKTLSLTSQMYYKLVFIKTKKHFHCIHPYSHLTTEASEQTVNICKLYFV